MQQCNFRLVTNNNIVPILSRFKDIASFTTENNQQPLFEKIRKHFPGMKTLS